MIKTHSPGFLAVSEAARKNVTELSLIDVKGMLDRGKRLVLLDVREDHEWTQGHLPEAQHLARGILERDVEVRFPDRGTTIVCYCGGGFRSALAAQTLQAMGYTKVRSMWGGWRGWTEAKLPVTSPKHPERPESIEP